MAEAPSGGSRKILIASGLVLVTAAGAGGLWLHGRAASEIAAPAASADVAAAVAAMTPQQKQQSYQNAVDALQAQTTQLQNYVDGLPKSLTDLDALAGTLTTPQAAFEYVRDQIALEPYPGVLKGALGTLITRGGNDLDRALLLAALLKAQGTDVKLARGRLSAAQAQGLLQQIAAAPDAVDQIVRTLPSLKSDAPAGNDPDRALFDEGVSRRRKELDETVAKTFQQLQTSLKGAGIVIGRDASSSQLTVIEDHFWLQATIDEKTVDLDPSLASAPVGQSLCTPTAMLDADNLPDDLFQRLQFHLVAEHLQASRVKATDVLSQEVKSVDLFGKNVRMAIEPESTSPDVNAFRGVLTIGDDTTTGHAFGLRPDDSSNSSDAPAEIVGGQSSDAGAVGGGLGAMGGVGGGSGGGGSTKPSAEVHHQATPAGIAGHGEPVLGRLRFEVVSVGPHLPEVRYRRVLMDRLESRGGTFTLSPALANDKSIRPLLISVWDGAIAVGPVHPVYTFQTEAAAIAAQEPLEEKSAAKTFLGETMSGDDVPAPGLSPNLMNYFLSSDLARHSLRVTAAPRVRAYYERPRLAFIRHGFAIGDWSTPAGPVRYLEGIDLINAPFEFVGPADAAATLAMKSGIADTVLELHVRAGKTPINTVPLMAAAAEQAVPLMTVKSGGAGLVSVAVPAGIHNALQQDVESGHVIVAPAKLVAMSGRQQFGWWSIDASTGFSVGRMDVGGSQGLVEAEKLHERITKWTETFAKFYGGVIKCFVGGIGDAIGEVGTDDDLKFQVTLKSGDESPVPGAAEVSDCLMDAACDALADLVGEEIGEAASQEEVSSLEDVIWNLEAQKGIGAGIGKSGAKVCTGALKKALG